MKLLFTIIILIILVIVSLVIISKAIDELPQITFPKAAQHNNIGELPIVEMADDGVFAEIDGAEEFAKVERWENQCYNVVVNSCDFYDGKTKRQVKKEQRKYRRCMDKATNKDGSSKYDGDGWPLDQKCGWKPPVFDSKEKCKEKAREACKGGTPKCDALYDLGLGMFTCWGTFQ